MLIPPASRTAAKEQRPDLVEPRRSQGNAAWARARLQRRPPPRHLHLLRLSPPTRL